MSRGGLGLVVPVMLALSTACAAPTYRRTLITDEIAPYSSPAQVDAKLRANHMCRHRDWYRSCETTEHDLAVYPAFEADELVGLTVAAVVPRFAPEPSRWDLVIVDEQKRQRVRERTTRRLFAAFAVELRTRYGAPSYGGDTYATWRRPGEWIVLQIERDGWITEQHHFPRHHPARWTDEAVPGRWLIAGP